MSLAHRRGPWGAEPYGHVIDRGGWRLYLEPSPKRLRLEVAGVTVADSHRPRLLHQPGAPAAWWLPADDVRTDLLSAPVSSQADPLLGAVASSDLQIADRVEVGFARRHPDVSELDGLLGLDWRRIDRAFEEDEQVASEPIDPYHRVDVRRTSRHVRISLDSVVIAESRAPTMVFETTARPRFYLTAAELRTDLLEPSASQGVCQYKGVADYFHLRLPDRLVEDLVWSYREPGDDGRRLLGRYAIHHERCRTELDGREVTAASAH